MSVRALNVGTGPLEAGPAPGRSNADPLFRLVDIGLLNVLPLAGARGLRAFFAAVGFEGPSGEALATAYGRHKIPGVLLPSLEPADGFLTGLAQAAGLPAEQRFDCLSLLDGTAGRHALTSIEADRWRPAIIHCADQAWFGDAWPSFRSRLDGLRYNAIGALSGAEIFIDAKILEAPAAKPAIATFDVFDTLIARRCIEPWRVFAQVGERAGIPDFVAQRQQAEARVLHGAYVYDDIYDELASHYGWTEARRRDIQALEMSCELDAVMPIAENLEKVRDGDLLVSDMYLGEAQIRALLAAAGLTKQVGLVVESHGKASGRVWPLITGAFDVTRHLGDNPHADIAVPGRLGIETAFTKAHAPTEVEETLRQIGLTDLAHLCREARLSTWNADPALRALEVVQVSLNLPILILASIRIARLAQERGSETLLFCSRDSHLWLALFQEIQAKMGLSLDARYFLTSRLARKKGSATYLDYARREFGRKPLVIDLCGTGWSMAHLAERLGRSDVDLFMIDHCPPLSLFEQASRTPDNCTVHAMFDDRPDVNNIPLELANAARHGMVLDMRKTANAFTPVLAPYRARPDVDAAIEAQQSVFRRSLGLLGRYGLGDVLTLDDASLSQVCRALYICLAEQAPLFARFERDFQEENTAIVQALIRAA